MKRINWNAFADTSLHGWQFDELVKRWAKEEADKLCEQCNVGGDCIHNAARTLLGLIRFVDHPDNCPECKRIHEKDKPEEP